VFSGDQEYRIPPTFGNSSLQRKAQDSDSLLSPTPKTQKNTGKVYMRILQRLAPLLYAFIVSAVLTLTPTLACLLSHSTPVAGTFAWALVSF
jgi:hypothetical protein